MRKQIILGLCLLVSAGCALAELKYFAGQNGIIYRSQINRSASLEYSVSSNGGKKFSTYKPIYFFTTTEVSYDLVVSARNFYLVYQLSDEVCYIRSHDEGQSWTSPQNLSLTGEALSAPVLALDYLGQPHLLFRSFNNNNLSQKLYYLNLVTGEPQVLFATQDKITAPRLMADPAALVVRWQNSFLSRADDYFAVSLDGGRHFSPASPGVAYPPLSPPLIVKPAANLVTNALTIEVTSQNLPRQPVSVLLELATDDNFSPLKTWSFNYFSLAGSWESNCRLPFDLPDGNYAIRGATFDGLTRSDYSRPIHFQIDRQPPLLQIISPTSETCYDSDLQLQGKLNETAKLSLNGLAVSLEADQVFFAPLGLKPGANRLLFIATDEVGNQTILEKTIHYSAVRPHLKIIKPQATSWFRPGSALLVEAEITPGLAGITDESEGEIAINGSPLADKLSYDKTSGLMTGFIVLPKSLPDRQAKLKITLIDSAGEMGVKEQFIQIDNSPPQLQLDQANRAFTNSLTRINLPLQDVGCGLDLAGTLIKISGLTFEVTGSSEAWYIKPFWPLSKDSYSIEVVPRDQLGNTGPPAVFNLLVDLIPPDFLLYSAEPNSNNLLVSGEVTDNFLAGINVYNNDLLVDSFLPVNKFFSRQVKLKPGTNLIRFEAADRAGNKTVHSHSYQGQNVTANALLTKFGSGPNPFSPGRDGQMYFTYTAPAPFTIKAHIFDLTGTLIWKKEVSNTTNPNRLSWGGYNHFGQLTGNGLYPYVVVIESAGQTEIRRGKIILLN